MNEFATGCADATAFSVKIGCSTANGLNDPPLFTNFSSFRSKH